MEDQIDQRWRKSSYSGNGGGSCVEVGQAPPSCSSGTRRPTDTARCSGSPRPRGAGSRTG